MIHLIALLFALALAVAMELLGVARHKAGKVDTYTEVVAWVTHRAGPFAFPIVIFLVGMLAWAIPHFIDTAL